MTAFQLSDTLQYALECNWLPPGLIVNSASENKISKELHKQKPQPVGYAQVETALGMQLGTTLDRKDIGLISAAARIAQVYPNMILVERIEPDLFWLCITEDGAIFPSGDMTGNQDIIKNRLTEALADVGNRAIDIFDADGEFFDLKSAVPKNFAQLIAEKPDFNETGSVVRALASRSHKKSMFSMAAFALLSLLGVFAWYWYSEKLQTDPKEIRAQQLAAQKAQQRETELKQLGDALSQNAALLLYSINDVVGAYPRRSGGWQVQQYEWKNEQLAVIWRRNHGNIMDLLDLLGNAQSSFDEKSGVIIEHLQVHVEPKEISSDLNVSLASVGSRNELIDRLASLPGSWSITSPQIDGIEFPVAVSTFKGEGVGLSQLKTVALILQDLPVQIQLFRAEWQKRLQWQLTGKHYAQSS